MTERIIENWWFTEHRYGDHKSIDHFGGTFPGDLCLFLVGGGPDGDWMERGKAAIFGTTYVKSSNSDLYPGSDLS